jgi:hypothetical protein
MASNPTGFKISCDNTYPASNGTFYDLDDIFIRKEKFQKGGLWIWGSGVSGQLGNDLTTSRSSPIQTCISGNSWRKICLSKYDGNFAVALTCSGSVWGWGRNNVGQLADGTFTDSLCPKKLIIDFDDVKLISAGGAGATVYSPGLDITQTDQLSNRFGYGESVEPCRIAWGCRDGARLGFLGDESAGECCRADFIANNTTTIENRRQWVDISLGNRYGVGLVDEQWSWCYSPTTPRNPGALLEWGAGAPTHAGTSNTADAVSFNGTSSYLVVAGGASNPFVVGNANTYVVEGWFYPCTLGKTQVIFDTSSNTSNLSSVRLLSDNKLGYTIGSSVYMCTTYRIAKDRWHHFALERVTNAVRLYLNGRTVDSMATNAPIITWNSGDMVIGGSGFNRGALPGTTNDGYFCGLISSLRFVKDVAYNTISSYNVPANPLTTVANTTFLLRSTSSISDGSVNNLNISCLGSPTIVTQKYSLPLDLNPTTPFAYGINPVFQISDESWKCVSAGNSHALAIKCDGTLWAWGCNDKGQLGTSDTLNRSCPTQIGTANTWTNISAGCNFSSAILAGIYRCNAAVIYTWGENSSGQLGINATTNRSSPTQINSGCTNWRRISAGDSHFAALQTDGTIWTWGSNQFGELGRNDRVNRSSPVQVSGNTTGWYDVSAGQCATAGLRENAW